MNIQRRTWELKATRVTPWQLRREYFQKGATRMLCYVVGPVLVRLFVDYRGRAGWLLSCFFGIRLWPERIGIMRRNVRGWTLCAWTWGFVLCGCTSAPARVVATPNVCPGLPSTPAQARTQFPEFLPVLDPSVSDAASAGEVLRVRVDSAALYQACRANNAVLESWVISHSKE